MDEPLQWTELVLALSLFVAFGSVCGVLGYFIGRCKGG